MTSSLKHSWVKPEPALVPICCGSPRRTHGEPVGQCFYSATSECVYVHALGQHIAGLTSGNIAEREDTIENFALVAKLIKDKTLAKCR